MTAATSGMTVPKNKQGIFDRQLEMCATFVNFNYSKTRTFDYAVDNNCIALDVFYDKLCEWSCETGKRQLIDLVKHYKLHLLGYDLHRIRFVKEINGCSRYKHTCKYVLPLNLLKFDYNVFYFDKDYLEYEKIDRVNKFTLF